MTASKKARPRRSSSAAPPPPPAGPGGAHRSAAAAAEPPTYETVASEVTASSAAPAALTVDDGSPPGVGGADAPAASPPHDDRWAAATIQRVCRRRGALRRFFETVARARASFLDDEAIAAGATRGQFYTDSALVMRELARHTPEVEAALEEAWLAITEADPSANRGDEAVSPIVYVTFYRKLYLHMHDEGRDGDIDPIDCLDSMRRDWKADTGALDDGSPRRESFDRESFFRSVYQLADLSTDSVSREDYAEWIRRATARVTTVGLRRDASHAAAAGLAGKESSSLLVPTPRVYWRRDAELLEGVCARARLPPSLRQRLKAAGAGAGAGAGQQLSAASMMLIERQRLFRSRRTQWEVRVGAVWERAVAPPPLKHPLHPMDAHGWMHQRHRYRAYAEGEASSRVWLVWLLLPLPSVPEAQ